jgi:hypothetical protein
VVITFALYAKDRWIEPGREYFFACLQANPTGSHEVGANFCNRRWFVLEQIISVSLRFPRPFGKWTPMPRPAGQCRYMQHSSCVPMAPCCSISSLRMGLRNSWRHRTHMSQFKHVIAFARSMYDLDDCWKLEMHSSAALMVPCCAISSLKMGLRNSRRRSTYVSQRKDVIVFQVCRFGRSIKDRNARLWDTVQLLRCDMTVRIATVYGIIYYDRTECSTTLPAIHRTTTRSKAVFERPREDGVRYYTGPYHKRSSQEFCTYHWTYIRDVANKWPMKHLPPGRPCATSPVSEIRIVRCRKDALWGCLFFSSWESGT